MPTLVSNLFTPAQWATASREAQDTFANLFTSGVVRRLPEFDALASGGGVIANVPIFADITDQSDEIQVENAAPSTDNTITASTMVAAMCSRQTMNTFTAMSAGIAGVGRAEDLGKFVTEQVIQRRLKQRQTAMLHLLRGAFGTAPGAALGSASPLASMRLTACDESGNDASSGQTLNGDLFINGKALLGELGNMMQFGAFFVHPHIRAALEKADSDSFKSGVVSGLPYGLDTYRGVPIFTSSLLVRAGTTNGSVYDSYLVAAGRFGYGERPQVLDEVSVAALQSFADFERNVWKVIDRTRFLLHLNGMKWVGTPANVNGGPNNAEMANVNNWQLAFSSANRVGAVCILTNA